MSNSVVLDASAVLALLHREPGHEEVMRHLDTTTAFLSTVNLAEVAAKQLDINIPSAQLIPLLELIGMKIIDLNSSQAMQIGKLKLKAKPYGLSLGDLACLALGQQLNCPVITADRIWARIDTGIDVILIR